MSTDTQATSHSAGQAAPEGTSPRRVWLGRAMTAFGAFLLAVAVLTAFYASSALKVAPADTDEDTVLSGTALLPANFSDPANLEQAPVKVFKHDLAVKSTNDAVVYDSSLCLVRDEGGIEGCVASDDPEGRQVSVTTDHFATDRKTGESINDPALVGDGAVEHEGLVNKFPFDVQKTTYMVWDGVLGQAVPTTYADTVTVNGLEVYTFTSSASSDSAEILPDITGRYTDEATYYVEPRTGSIVNKVEKQERFIGADQLLLSLDVQLTDEQVAKKVDDTKDSLAKLDLISKWVPLGALVLGLPLLLGGLWQSRRRA